MVLRHASHNGWLMLVLPIHMPTYRWSRCCDLHARRQPAVKDERRKNFVHRPRLGNRLANLCRQRGVRHFELLGAVGADCVRARSICAPRAVARCADCAQFRTAVTVPAVTILTPSNRFGFEPGAHARFWPTLSHLMLGPARKFRGIRVEALGAAIAHNLAVTARASRRCR